MRRVFPLYKNHDEVRCFNCGNPTKNKQRSASAYGQGNGGWKQTCLECNLTTFYDIEEKPDEGIADNR